MRRTATTFTLIWPSAVTAHFANEGPTCHNRPLQRKGHGRKRRIRRLLPDEDVQRARAAYFLSAKNAEPPRRFEPRLLAAT